MPVDIWCDIDLDDVPKAKCYRPETIEWAERVNWPMVTDLVRSVIAECAAADELADLPSQLKAAVVDLSETDQDAAYSLYMWPIMASQVQITNGGHRIDAMRKQGVRWAIGQGYFDDVGRTIDPLSAYLPPSLRPDNTAVGAVEWRDTAPERPI